MKEYMVEAFVLKSIPTREADRLIILYTREAGKKKAMAHGVEKPTSRKRGAVQPFSRSLLQLRRGRDLDSVVQGECLEIFPKLRQDLNTLAKASYMVELLDSCTVEDDPNRQVFSLMGESMAALGNNNDFLVARSFEIRLLASLGFRPVLDICVLCGQPPKGSMLRFLPGPGGVACHDCRSGPDRDLLVSRGSVESMKTMMQWPVGKLSRLKVSSAAGMEIKDMMRQFIDFHLGARIKSIKFDNFMDDDQTTGHE